MLAWQVGEPAALEEHPEAGSTARGHPLQLVEREAPQPGPGEVAVSVRACGVCRTDLHIVEGDLPVHRDHVVPGHEVVGVVSGVGPGATRFALGERVGVAWLASTCGVCEACRRGRENLCAAATFTGWDRDGGYAQTLVADERYAYRLPEGLPDDQVAPLLCAGIIGYRALKVASLPPGGTLGIYGFGGSAHITAQIALAQGAEVMVVTRSERARQLATELGARWVGEAGERPPLPLDSAILFAPDGDLVPPALAALGRGGVLAVAGIYLSEVPRLDYQRHLFFERSLKSVTANTRRDGEELLTLARRLGVRTTVQPYPFSGALDALRDLAHGRVTGAAVLQVDESKGRSTEQLGSRAPRW